MSGRSGNSFASSMAGAGAQSGRGGRERQGEAQQRQNDQDGLGRLSDSSSSDNQDNLQPRPNASRRSSYSLWTEPKKTCVLQAIIDTPRQMLQNVSENQENNFDRNRNRSGELKDSLDKLECVSDLYSSCNWYNFI